MDKQKTDKVLSVGVMILGFVCIVMIVAFMAVGVDYKPIIKDDGTIHKVPDDENKGVYNILVAGTDKISNSTDVMMIVNVNTVDGKISIIQIPRDTYVSEAASGYKGIKKINAVYAKEYSTGRSSGYSQNNSKRYAINALSAFLSNSLGIKIDDYVLLSTTTFKSTVDAVGGVYFDVPYDMFYEDPEQDLYIDVKAGYQLLDGDKAEQVIRYREAIRADLGRTEIRAEFMRQMAVQVKAKMDFAACMQIVPEILNNTITSLDLQDIMIYLKAAYDLSLDDMTIKTMTGNIVWDESRMVWTSEYYLNRFAAVRDINTYLCSKENQITVEEFDKKGYFRNDDNKNALEFYLREDL